MSIDDYLRQSLATTLLPFLPPHTQWFEHPEGAVIWVSVFRVFRVPYDTQVVRGKIAEFGQVRAVFTNVNLPYFNMAFGFNPTPEGGVEPKGNFVGWEASDRGVLLLLMTPLKSDGDLDPEIAARYRIDSARATIVAVMGLNAAFEQVCELSIEGRDASMAGISRNSPAMENPGFYETPDIEDSSAFEPIRSVLEGIESLDSPTQNRVRLALRWYQRALGDRRVLKLGGGNVDALINYWVALETLVRVGEQKVTGALIGALSDIHGLSRQEVGQTFPISKIYERRKKIVHQGELMLGMSFELQRFLSDVFLDILVLRIMRLSSIPRTQKYLDGRATQYL